MACAKGKYVYAVLIGITLGFQSFVSYGKGKKSPDASNNSSAPVASKDQFQWYEHSRLSWDDFKGAAKAANDASAAATYCGIGIKTNVNGTGAKPEIVVYNTFYTKKSWVREDARIQSILEHEQGHFDLCEIYTRKLRDRIKTVDAGVAQAGKMLLSIYTQVNKEYENRQQAYEQETVHGTNAQEQRRWVNIIESELRTEGL